jgi:hypothetical protein
MKSGVKVDLRPPYTMAIFNRKDKEVMNIRQKMVRYAQQHGIKPAAKYFGCSKNTVKQWLHRFNESGARGLENKSRDPHSCPHKTSQEMEDLIRCFPDSIQRTNNAHQLYISADYPCTHSTHEI